MAGNDDSGGPDSYLRFTVPEDDKYVICVQDHLSKGGADYVYRVEVTPVEAAADAGPARAAASSSTSSVAGAAGQPHGDSGQRASGPISAAT